MSDSAYTKAIRDFANTLRNASNSKTSPYDTLAEVTRIDGDTAWVHIPGGVDETPVQLTTNAKRGDTVRVRVSGGSAWLYGNATSPPTDDTRANEAKRMAATADENAISAVTSAGMAKEAADSAQASATSAAESALAANTLLDQMEDAATAAGTTLTQIYQDAKDAGTSAQEAKTLAGQARDSATLATNAATSAQWQLGAIEDVVGTLEWISTHAIYITTDDTAVEPGKWYYNLTATEVTELYRYRAVENPVVADISTYYEYDSTTGTYSLTQDQTIVSGKTYYTRSPKTYEVQSGRYYTRDTTYRYFVVAEPVQEDIGTYYEYDSTTGTYSLTQDQTIDEEKTYYTRTAYYIYISANSIVSGTTYYTVVATAASPSSDANPYQLVLYEIDSYDKTIQNYISTHLSLDENGLHLTDGSQNKMDISQTDGITLYNAGVQVAKYGANTLIGKEDGFHIRITPTKLSFETGTNTEVAFMTGEVLNIPRVVVVDSLQIGNWMWDGNNNPMHLTLRWIGED